MQDVKLPIINQYRSIIQLFKQSPDIAKVKAVIIANKLFMLIYSLSTK